MSYAALDPALYPWARRHGLYILTRSPHETEDRAVTIVDDFGDTYSMRLTPPNEDGQVCVTVYSASVRRGRALAAGPQIQAYYCSVAQLPETLETAYSLAEAWIHERGHTRTPVV